MSVPGESLISVISFNLESEETTINFINRTKRHYYVTILHL